MTKKDYKAIAEGIERATLEGENGRVALPVLVNELQKVMKADNPRFDAELFRAACYGEPFKK